MFDRCTNPFIDVRPVKRFGYLSRAYVPLVEVADIGQTRGPEDLTEYTHPVCPGHYNHMVVSGNLTIGHWAPQRQWTDGTEEIRLVWKGNSFEIVYEPDCMYCKDSEEKQNKGYGPCDRDGVLPIQFVEKGLRR